MKKTVVDSIKLFLKVNLFFIKQKRSNNFIVLSANIFATESLTIESEKTYILSFFASWCSSCKKEIPQLSAIAKKYKSRGIELIGIDVDKDKEEAKAFQESLKEYFTFRVVDDSENKIIKKYKPLGMPAVYIIKDQKVCAKIFGAQDELEQEIAKELKNCGVE